MAPRSRGVIRRRAAWVPWTKPKYVTSVARRSSSGRISSTGAKTVEKAAFTHTSMGPSSSSARAAAASTASGSATSTTSGSARPPASRTSSAARARAYSPRAIRATALPRAPKARAVARRRRRRPR
ncbi:hypothetical protein TPA0906_70620 [Streptomyces olivaceus]|nr:hypothetical protein TPA0906_70620 [Streptomyces olivaceus]